MLNKMSGNPKRKRYLKDGISIALQRGNATSVLKTLPEAEGLDEFFCL